MQNRNYLQNLQLVCKQFALFRRHRQVEQQEETRRWVNWYVYPYVGVTLRVCVCVSYIYIMTSHKRPQARTHFNRPLPRPFQACDNGQTANETHTAVFPGGGR